MSCVRAPATTRRSARRRSRSCDGVRRNAGLHRGGRRSLRRADCAARIHAAGARLENPQNGNHDKDPMDRGMGRARAVHGEASGGATRPGGRAGWRRGRRRQPGRRGGRPSRAARGGEARGAGFGRGADQVGGGGKTRISGYDPMEQSAPLEPAREHRDPVGHLHPVGLRPGGENAARATGLGGGGDRPVVVAVPVALAVAGRRSGPNFASNGCNPPQREIALRAAGLRARGYGQDPGEAVLQPEPRSTLPESNPHDEPATGRLAAGLRSGGEREATPRLALPVPNR